MEQVSQAAHLLVDCRMAGMSGSRFSGAAKDLWLPVLVSALGSALSCSAWNSLLEHREALIRGMVSGVAAQSRRTVSDAVADRVVALRNLAGVWVVAGERPFEEWRASVDLLIEHFPNLEYVAWVSADGRRQRVTAGKFESPASIAIEPNEARVLGADPSLVGPERDEDGVGFRVFLPVQRGDLGLGVLEARFDIDGMLADVLADSAPGYAIEIRWGDTGIFRRGEPSRDAGHSWWRAEGPVPLPFGVTWTMTHAPTPELAAAWLLPDPHYLLGIGIALAIAFGLLAHQLRMSVLQSRSLATGNRSLEAGAGELRKLTEALETRVAERTAELEAFTHSISHDLRSPLGAILNFTAILESEYRDRLDADGLDALDRIHSSAVRGRDLLDGLLRLSRAGHSTLVIAEFDMAALARESFAHARASELDADVEFMLEPLPNARGDRSLIGEVLVNLFDNALKYSRGREKRRVTMRGSLQAGQCVYEVSDNGRGFDMKYADKLFGLFERVHSSRDAPEGTGVGLALVARIVQRHGGRVSAEGKVDDGARFTFTLPPGRAASP